jgi:CDP-diacylglycerol--glycerol-3-phosphate 3-phosphatidyltransferase
MNIANRLTLFRIALVPLFIFFLIIRGIPNSFLISEVIFLVACFTDQLDGYIARKRNEVTVFGEFLDPLADKILVTSAFLCFIDLGLISSIPVILILFREFMVISIRLIAVGQGKVIPASIWGKAKTLMQMVSVSFIILFLYFQNIGILDISTTIFLSNIFMWICVIITWISGVFYIYNDKEVFKS